MRRLYACDLNTEVKTQVTYLIAQIILAGDCAKSVMQSM